VLFDSTPKRAVEIDIGKLQVVPRVAVSARVAFAHVPALLRSTLRASVLEAAGNGVSSSSSSFVVAAATDSQFDAVALLASELKDEPSAHTAVSSSSPSSLPRRTC
jgi:hypothetical protein